MDRFGAAKLYHCFLDEALNADLRSVCQFAHRRSFPERVHRLFDIRARLKSDGFYARSKGWESLVEGREM